MAQYKTATEVLAQHKRFEELTRESRARMSAEFDVAAIALSERVRAILEAAR